MQSWCKHSSSNLDVRGWWLWTCFDSSSLTGSSVLAELQLWYVEDKFSLWDLQVKAFDSNISNVLLLVSIHRAVPSWVYALYGRKKKKRIFFTLNCTVLREVVHTLICTSAPSSCSFYLYHLPGYWWHSKF